MCDGGYPGEEGVMTLLLLQQQNCFRKPCSQLAYPQDHCKALGLSKK